MQCVYEMMLKTNQKDNLFLHRYRFPNREQFLFQGNVKSRGALCLKVDNETYSRTLTVFLFLFKIIAIASFRFGQVLL